MSIQRIAAERGVNPETVNRAYHVWLMMLQRCYLPSCNIFHKYGAKGVTVCDRWRDSFEAFIDDMGFGAVGLSIDRINNAKVYSPETCRWATNTQQQRNRTNNRLIEYEGETLCVADVADRCGIPDRVLRRRLSSGWTVERATTTPVKKQKGTRN
ncbi:MAG: hypothetical protein AAFN70_14840, partial [Planctomycetota bacterium]